VTVDPGGRSGVVTVPSLEPEPVSQPQVAPAKGAGPPVAPALARSATAVEPKATPGPGRSPQASSPRILGLVAAGIGTVSIAVGSVLGIEAKLHLDDSNSNGHCDPYNHCDAIGTMARHQAIDAATGSTIAFAAGGILVAAGLGLYFTTPSSTTPSKRWRGAAASWLSVEIRPVVGVHEQGLAMHARF
jgi:hypothetical protein